MLKLKIVRITQGLTQFTVSQSAGISQGRFSMLERGLVDPTDEERDRLAAVLRASPSALFRSAIRERSQPIETGKI